MRSLTVPLKNRLLASPTRPVFLWEGQFASGYLRLWNEIGDLSFGGNTYLGNGWMTKVSGASETDDTSAQDMVVTLTGVPQDILSLVLNAPQGALGNFYLGALAENGALVADPYKIFSGKLDVPTISETASGPRVEISYESRLVDFDRPREFRYTTESQKIFYPTDRGFEYVRVAGKWDGFWGQSQKEADKRRKQREQKQKKSNRR